MNETVNNTPETENKENVKGKSEIWEYVRIVVAVVLVAVSYTHLRAHET